MLPSEAFTPSMGTAIPSSFSRWANLAKNTPWPETSRLFREVASTPQLGERLAPCNAHNLKAVAVVVQTLSDYFLPSSQGDYVPFPCITEARFSANCVRRPWMPGMVFAEPGSLAVCIRQNLGGSMAVLLKHMAPSSCWATRSLPE